MNKKNRGGLNSVSYLFFYVFFYAQASPAEKVTDTLESAPVRKKKEVRSNQS